MKPLEPPDSLHLQSAQGWLELGNYLEANAELENITPEQRAHPDVLEMRWHIYAHEGKWDACLSIASTLIQLVPERSHSWVHHSYALHCLKRTQAAFDELLPVAGIFPNTWEIPYNLACYCAQLGLLAAAEHWFRKAMEIDHKAVQTAGIDDPDLVPLWDSMSTTFWKRTE